MSPAAVLRLPTAMAASRPRLASGGVGWGLVRLLSRVPSLRAREIVIDTVDNFAEDEPPKDKYYRKYASGIERALSLFDTALQEWADYISFLNRLLKVGFISLPE